MPIFIADISEILKPSDFYSVGLGEIYGKILSYFAGGKPIDVLTLGLSVEEQRDLGVALDSMAVPTLPIIKAYAEEIKDVAQKRRLLSVAGEIAGIAHDAYESETPADEAQSQALQALLDTLEASEVW